LHVVDFNLTPPNPNSLTVGQGGTSQASTFQVTAAGSFSGTVALSCPTGLPADAACVFSPSSSVTPTSTAPATVTLTVTAAVGTPAVGPVTVTLSAMTAGAPSAKTQTFSLTVTKATPDFAIAVVANPNATVANQNVNWNGTLTALNGYSGTVALTCTAGAPGTCGISPPTLKPTAGGAQFTVSLGSAAAGAFSFTIQGTDGALTHATPTETLTVGTDVAWANTGSANVNVLAGQSASFTFTATPVGDVSFSSAVTLQCVNLPAMTGCQFSPVSIGQGMGTTPVTLTIWTCGPNLPTLCPPGTGEGVGRSTNRLTAILPFSTLAWLSVVGIVGISRRTRDPRFYLVISRICLGLGLIAEISCGGVGGGGGTAPPVTVTVTPASGTVLYAAESKQWPAGVTQQQFKATVNGSTNQNVTWAVTGGINNGVVDQTGLFSSPAAVSNPPTVSVTATSSLAQSPGTGFVNLVAATPLGTSQITAAATAMGGSAHGSVVTLTVQ
jgi:plastocyanin